MNTTNFENRIKDLLEKKITDQEYEFLHGFYAIDGVYRYSLYNSILIGIQGGSIAMGFNRWAKIGRYVKRGEKASIEILVPQVIQDKDKNETEATQRCIGFFTKKVFDIKQTDGKPLEYRNNSTETTTHDYLTIRLALGTALKVDISEDLTGSARGYYIPIKNKIVISSMSNNVDKIKTLVHETGHYLLHGEKAENIGREAKEVEAELVALLTCNALGLNPQQSESYIKSYNENKPEVRVLKVIGAVQKILNIIIGENK